MPIPPRPIPTPARRPGHSVPHKPKSTLSPNISNTLDWRAEVAFLDSYAQGRKARSVPSPGVVIMDAATRARERERDAEREREEREKGEREGREVGLEELIHDCKGKREKRATTAATLGFDFIHTPSVVVLPDDPSPPYSPTSKLNIKLKASTPPTPLIQTPRTPSLLATLNLSAMDIPTSGRSRCRTSNSDEEDDNVDDGWEHIQLLDGAGEAEDDEMILGELELEDELEKMELVDKREVVGMRRVEGVSYAAALGR